MIRGRTLGVTIGSANGRYHLPAAVVPSLNGSARRGTLRGLLLAHARRACMEMLRDFHRRPLRTRNDLPSQRMLEMHLLKRAN